MPYINLSAKKLRRVKGNFFLPNGLYMGCKGHGEGMCVYVTMGTGVKVKEVRILTVC